MLIFEASTTRQRIAHDEMAIARFMLAFAQQARINVAAESGIELAWWNTLISDYAPAVPPEPLVFADVTPLAVLD